MIQQIMEEIRYIRTRLDSHINDEETDFKELRKDIARIREETSAHKTRLGSITSGIAAVVAGVISWIVYKINS